MVDLKPSLDESHRAILEMYMEEIFLALYSIYQELVYLPSVHIPFSVLMCSEICSTYNEIVGTTTKPQSKSCSVLGSETEIPNDTADSLSSRK